VEFSETERDNGDFARDAVAAMARFISAVYTRRTLRIVDKCIKIRTHFVVKLHFVHVI